MIRPELRAQILRWREAIGGLGALLFGAYLAVTSSGLPTLFGLALMVVSTFLIVSGLRHGRFRTGALGPGILRTDEGRIAYMGPITGGVVALDDLIEVTLLRNSDGQATWRLISESAPPLDVPEGAEGADALLDALAPLPGFDGGYMVRAVQARTPGLISVWRRDPLRALT